MDHTTRAAVQLSKVMRVVFTIGDAIILIVWIMGLPRVEGFTGFIMWILLAMPFLIPCEFLRRMFSAAAKDMEKNEPIRITITKKEQEEMPQVEEESSWKKEMRTKLQECEEENSKLSLDNTDLRFHYLHHSDDWKKARQKELWEKIEMISYYIQTVREKTEEVNTDLRSYDPHHSDDWEKAKQKELWEKIERISYCIRIAREKTKEVQKEMKEIQ